MIKHGFAGVGLLSWSPPKKASDAKGGLPRDAALQFREAAARAADAVSSSIDNTVLHHHGLLIVSWRRFVSNWLASTSTAVVSRYLSCSKPLCSSTSYFVVKQGAILK